MNSIIASDYKNATEKYSFRLLNNRNVKKLKNA